MTDSTGTTTYTYDSMGRILTKTHSETGTVSYSYDNYENIPYGYVAEITTEPDGDSVEKWYDSEDKIIKVIDGSDITEYNYYADGRLKSTTKPDGSVSTNTYDDEGNLLTLVTLDAAEDVLDSFTYVYDDNSIGYKNQISKTEIVAGVNKGTTSYEYDIQGRLIKATNPDESYNEYTYDDAGNRLTKTSVVGETSVVTSYTYDNENRLTQSITGNATTYYGYDNNGNQISQWTRFSSGTATNGGVSIAVQSEETDDLLTLYEYDIFDRLVKIEQGADVIENIYTADGKKLSRTTNGDTTYYVYDGNVVIEEQDSNNDESARNVYGRNIITRQNDLNKIVYGFNGHGDVVYQADIDGTVLEVYTYDEFGNPAETAFYQIQPRAPGFIEVEDAEEVPINIHNPYRYAGYEYIEEVKLYDLNARYYNPEIARFLSADPYYDLGNRVIGLYEINVPTAASIMQANNIYAYCGNNPILFKDTNGQFWDVVFDVVTVVISVVAVISNPKSAQAWVELGGDVVDLAVPFLSGVGESIKVAGAANDSRKVVENIVDATKTGKSIDNASEVAKMTTKQLTEAANKLGFEKTKYFSHGQPVYKKGNKYITPDVDSHNGGFWKMADSPEALGSKKTRMGTYDADLNRIGD